MATTSYNIAATGLETYRTSNSANVGQLFSKYIDLAVEEEDIFAAMEGPEGSDKPVWVKTDLTKDGADKVNFNAIASLGEDGKHGDEVLEGYEETLNIGSYPCQVDFVRHAIGLTQKDIKFLSAGKSIEAACAPLVAKWLGRKRQRDMLHKFISGAIGLNTIRPNNAATRNALTAADTLSTSFVNQGKAIVTTVGGIPINIEKDGYGKTYGYLDLFTEDALLPLKASSSYLQAAQQAQERGAQNTIFKGGYTNLDGNIIVPFKVIDADTPGPIGSPLLPKALLGTTIAAGTTAIDITGGGRTSPSTTPMFFENHSGAPYRYLESDATSVTDSTVYYVVIVNVSGADKGKWGFYSYTGTNNNGNKLTITERLGSASSGARVTTLGNVTWSSTLNTDAHPTGSVILQANSSGVPVGYGLCLGSGAGLRAYGSIRHEVIEQLRDYGHRKGWGYQSIYGQTVRKDSGLSGSNQPRGYVLMEMAITCANAPMILA